MPVKSNMDSFEKLAENTRNLQRKKSVKLADLMDSEFLAGCSDFKDLEHMFDESGFIINSKEDFEAIPDEEWEVFITNNTSFESWEDMQKAASAAFVKKQMLKGL
ncbi:MULTISPECIES: hypothetical protein [Vibrio harveyi group]|uniref:hypothetical protein n=1 Tax=Vibrio harveyi group TaxID=717610 RepID=UPI0007A0735B|nr:MULTISPECIES: hypothetical protein [Vibrio harveyi group]KYZ08715.1 hypothetical protein AW033_22255 [Vibrio parahaemolyticus]MCS0046645.1 hypothetical protein [Vibrio antiquarius]